MGMKVLLALSLFAVALFPAQSQHPAAALASQPIGRYQMIVGTLDEPPAEKTALLLDTATGKVWKYQGGSESKDAEGKETFNPPRFIFIPVDGLTVGQP